MKQISSIEAASSAYNRVRERLFKNFDFMEWMILGFVAWIANLGQNPHFGFNFNVLDLRKLFGENGGTVNNPADLIGKINPYEMLNKARDFFQSKTFLLIVVVAVAAFFLIAVISFIIAWIKANGKFLFVQNLVMPKTEIGSVWRKHSSKAFSFFLWSIIISFISLIVVVVMLAPVIFGIVDMFRSGANAANISMILAGMLMVFITGVIMSIISFMMNWFVVPVMIKKDCGFRSGFLAVWELARNNIFHFIGFIFTYIVIQIAFYSAYILIMLFTCCLCCIGGCLLSLPYVWAVVFLPYLAFLRYFSMEFLAQFGDDYNLFCSPEMVSIH